MASLALAAAPAAHAAGAIQIVAATFGKPNAARPFSFMGRLQQVCGDASTYCESFCTEAFIGGSQKGISLPFSAPPICRVVYRCGSEATQAVEAEKGDVIVLNCRR
jgi:hypothetical protein